MPLFITVQSKQPDNLEEMSTDDLLRRMNPSFTDYLGREKAQEARSILQERPLYPHIDVSADARYIAGRIIKHMWIIGVLVPLILAIVIALSASAHGQTTTAQPDPHDATIVIYRPHVFLKAVAYHPQVYCDNVALPKVKNGKYYTFQIAPGEHTILPEAMHNAWSMHLVLSEHHADAKKGGVEINAAPGETYYVRTTITIPRSNLVDSGQPPVTHLVLVPAQEATKELRKLKQDKSAYTELQMRSTAPPAVR